MPQQPEEQVAPLRRSNGMTAAVIPFPSQKIESVDFANSSAIRAVRYFAARRALEVTFPSGAVYLYRDVAQPIFDGLQAAKSAGGFFNDAILDRYRYERLR